MAAIRITAVSAALRPSKDNEEEEMEDSEESTDTCDSQSTYDPNNVKLNGDTVSDTCKVLDPLGKVDVMVKQNNITYCFVAPILVLRNDKLVPVRTTNTLRKTHMPQTVINGETVVTNPAKGPTVKVVMENQVPEGRSAVAETPKPSDEGVCITRKRKPLKSQMTNETTEESNCMCSVKGCERLFNTLDCLAVHHAAHKQENDQKNLVCSYEGCGRTFAWHSHYKYHLLTHSNEREYSCKMEGCNKSFLTLQRLKVHLRTHTGERPYVCSMDGCDKSFTTMGNLRNHHRTHTGERPFKCQEKGCKYAFAEFSSLKKHEVVHSGEKRFSCEYCGKTFSQSGSRNMHVNKQHRLARKQQGGQSSILVLTHYDEHMLQLHGDTSGDHVVTVSTQSDMDSSLNFSHRMLSTEEDLQSEMGLEKRGNVVVLSQPEELASLGQSYQSTTHEEVVYDNDILNMQSPTLSIHQHLEEESQDKDDPSQQMMDSILDS